MFELGYLHSYRLFWFKVVLIQVYSVSRWLKERRIFTPNQNACLVRAQTTPEVDNCKIFVQFHCLSSYQNNLYQNDSTLSCWEYVLFKIVKVYMTEFMKTWLQWVSTGPMLSVSLVPRLWPSPPRTMGDCLHLPLSSAIIMIIILSRGLIQLARAN